MGFNANEKIALVRVLSDLIKADGTVNCYEIEYIKHIYAITGVTLQDEKSANHITLENAVSTFSKMNNTNKHALICILQQLSYIDNDLADEESLFITAIFMSVGISMYNMNFPLASIISVKDNPMLSEKDQVLFLESECNKELQKKFEEEYDEINEMLEENNFHLIYMPELIKKMENNLFSLHKTLEHLRPSISSTDLEEINKSLSSFTTSVISEEIVTNCMDRKDLKNIPSSLMFRIPNKTTDQYLNFMILDLSSAPSPLLVLKNMFELRKNINTITPSFLKTNEKIYLESFKNETIINKVKEFVRIEYFGLHNLIVDSILKKYDKESTYKIVITSDEYEIFFVNEKRREEIHINLTPLFRMLYIFFLIKEEGLILEDLRSYRDILLKIYLKIKPKDANNKDKAKESINSIADATGSTLNPALSRINKKIRQIGIDNINMYCIDGLRGEAKGIFIDRALVEFHDKAFIEEIKLCLIKSNYRSD